MFSQPVGDILPPLRGWETACDRQSAGKLFSGSSYIYSCASTCPVLHPVSTLRTKNLYLRLSVLQVPSTCTPFLAQTCGSWTPPPFDPTYKNIVVITLVIIVIIVTIVIIMIVTITRAWRHPWRCVQPPQCSGSLPWKYLSFYKMFLKYFSLYFPWKYS